MAERRQRARGVTTFQRFVGSGSERQFAVLPASDDVSTFRVGWSARDIVGCPCPALELLARPFRSNRSSRADESDSAAPVVSAAVPDSPLPRLRPDAAFPPTDVAEGH
jgi:hypothetical protein